MGNLTHEEKLFLLSGVFIGAALAFALFATGVLDPVEDHESSFVRGESASMPATKKDIVLAEAVPPVASVAPEVD